MSMFRDSSRWNIVGFFVTVGTFVIHVIALVAPFWLFFPITNEEYVSGGLWHLCKHLSEDKSCSSICDAIICPINFTVTRVLITLGCGFLLAAVVCGIFKMFVFKENKGLVVLGICCCFIAGSCSFAGVIVFSAWVNLHVSFVFCIIAAITSVVSAVLWIVG